MLNHADVLIIGAGAAGLTAAYELAAAGRRVVVLEGRNRIGGRIYTQRDNSLRLPIELGAEFVHGKADEILALVDAAGLTLCDVTGRHWYVRAGTLLKSEQFWHKLSGLMYQMRQVAPEDRSFQQFIDSLPDDEETRKTKSLAVSYVQGFHAARTERISVHSLNRANEASERIDGDKQFRIVSGYDGIVHWLGHEAARHNAILYLQMVVTEVRWRQNEVEIVCNSKHGPQRFTARRALLTMPLGVLQTAADESGGVRFVPPLPEEKREAIRNLAVGQVLRVVLWFHKRFWEDLSLPFNGNRQELWQLGFIHSSDVPFFTWWTLLPVRAPLIVGWVGGPTAEGLSLCSEKTIIDQAISSVATILAVSEHDIRALLHKSYFHNWHSDPFARGAYSYVPVNCLEAQMSLARPLADTLFFAGEATSFEGHAGTVHGAIASGKRAANEILQR